MEAYMLLCALCGEKIEGSYVRRVVGDQVMDFHLRCSAQILAERAKGEVEDLGLEVVRGGVA
jgi:hypothetical protein